MIQEDQKSFRSQVSYVNLVAVMVITALIIVVTNSQLGALVFAAIGVLWTALTLRSGIDVNDEGFTVRGLLRTRRLSWADTDAFIVVSFSGSERSLLGSGVDYLAPATAGPQVVGMTMEAISTEALSVSVPMFSAVAAVTRNGERLRVHGTASTPIDPEFPAQAAAELNRRLQLQNPVATACAA